MPVSNLSRGASMAALVMALAASSAAIAQQTLPTIDVGNNRRQTGAAGQRASGAAGRGASTVAQSAQNGSGSGSGSGDRSGNGSAQSLIKQTSAGPVLGYKALTSISAMKLNIPIRDTPATVNVVTREQINDTASFRLQEALQYTPGVSTAGGFGGTVDNFTIRGFNTFRLLRNGLPIDNDQSISGPRDLANVERVEVLKGPAAMLFGRMDPGGAINYVTKEPLATPSYSLKQTLGSFQFYRTELDVTGPKIGDGVIAYRFNGAYETANSFRDFNNSQRVFLAPVVTAQVGPNTKLKFEFEYLNGHNKIDWGIPAVDWLIPGVKGRPAPVPRSRYFGEPGYNGNFYQNLFAGAGLEHKFSESLILRSQFNWAGVSNSNDSMFPLFVNPVDGELLRFQSSTRSRNTDTYYGTVNLEMKMNTGIADHTVLAGWDRNVQNTISHNWSNCCPTINIYAPIYTPASILPYGPETRQKISSGWWGVYAQDQIHVPGNDLFPGDFYLMPGVRYDFAGNAARYTTLGETVLNSFVQSDQLSFRVGGLYRPVNDIGIFANYVQGLGNPNNGVGRDGQVFQPENGTQVEFGAKIDALGGLLTTTGSLFEITRQNIATLDPIDPNYSIATGEARNRGFELESIGKLSDTINITAGYTFIDSRITQDNTRELIGNRYPNVSPLTGSLFLTKELAELLPGLTVGGGFIARSQAYANLENTIVLPAYGTVDLMAKYKFSVQAANLEAQLNVKNLFNTTFYPNANSAYGITVGPPLQIFGSIRAFF